MPPAAARVESDEFWRWGDDNLFPAALATMARRSTTHRRIVNDKADYISGKGFVCDEAAQPQLAAFVRRANGDGESLRQVLNKLAFDKALFGNAFLEAVTDAGHSFLSLYHQDASRCRVARDSGTSCCTTTGRRSSPPRRGAAALPALRGAAGRHAALDRPLQGLRTGVRALRRSALYRRAERLGDRLQDRPLEHLAARQLVPALGRHAARLVGRERGRRRAHRAAGRETVRREPGAGDVRHPRRRRGGQLALHPDRLAERRRLAGPTRAGDGGHRRGALVVPDAERTGLQLGIQRRTHPPRIRGGAEHRDPRRTGRTDRTDPRARRGNARGSTRRRCKSSTARRPGRNPST